MTLYFVCKNNTRIATLGGHVHLYPCALRFYVRKYPIHWVNA